MKYGQIALPLLISIAGAVAAPLIGFYAAQAATQKEISDISRQEAVLEAQQASIKEDLQEIKEDIKDIKRALNIR